MDDDYILSHGGTEDDIQTIAEANGATDPSCPKCGEIHYSPKCGVWNAIDILKAEIIEPINENDSSTEKLITELHNISTKYRLQRTLDKCIDEGGAEAEEAIILLANLSQA